MNDLDRQITDELHRVATTTTTSSHALDQIFQRATARRGPDGRRVVLAAATVALVGAGFGAIALTGDDGTAPTAASPPTVAVPASPTTEASNVPEDSPAIDSEASMGSPAASSSSLPSAGTVPGPQVFDDATLLSNLYVGFEVDTMEDLVRFWDNPTTADREAVNACMEQAGFPSGPDAPSMAEWIPTSPRFTMTPEEFAARYGLGVIAEILGTLPTGPETGEAPVPTGLSPEEKEEDPSGGAYDACIDRLVPPEHRRGSSWDPAWVAAHDYAWAAFIPLIEIDPDVVAAGERWSECMAEAGYDYAAPADAVEDFRSRIATAVGPEVEALLAEEIDVAIANAGCIEPYRTTLRRVLAERFDEFKATLVNALEAGIQTDAVG